jgi:hypothetical protein
MEAAVRFIKMCVMDRFKAHLKVPRPWAVDYDLEAVEDFKKNCASQPR